MLNILQKFSFKNFQTILIQTMRKMPLSVFFSLTAFVLIAVLIKLDNLNRTWEDNLDKAVFTLVVVFFLSIGMYLYAEGRQARQKEIYQIPTILFGLLFFYFFEENLFHNFQTEVMVYFVLTMLGIVAFVFIAPFIDKIKKQKFAQANFYVTVYDLVIKILMSLIVGVLTMILGFIALSALFSLFELDFLDKSNTFGYWADFSLVLLAPIFFLANLSFSKESTEESLLYIQANKFYAFLIKYIGLPAIGVYFLILYAYTIKVLMHFSDWPHGEVAWLVIIFSFLGYIVYLASYAFKDSFKPASFLRRILPIAIFLQTFMLFYAIGLRIQQYDITINRYLVVAFGLWLLGLSFYFIISKKKNLITPFYSLLLVVIFISIGPWSVYVWPEKRQENNLINNLHNAHILQPNGVVEPLSKYQDIDAELSGEIYGGIQYLCNYHGCHTLDKIFKQEIEIIKQKDQEEWLKNKEEQLKRAQQNGFDQAEITKIKERQYSGASNWLIVERLTKLLKVERYYKTANTGKIVKSYIFSNQDEYFDSSIDIAGYDYFVRVFSDSNFLNKVNDNKSLYHAVIDSDEGVLKIYQGKNEPEIIDIKNAVMQKLLVKKDDSIGERRNYPNKQIILSSEDMSFVLSDKTYDIKLVLREIEIKSLQDFSVNKTDNLGNIKFLSPPYASGYILLKKK